MLDLQSPWQSPDAGPAVDRPRESAPYGYRADVDGLRAVAVLAVVAYHAKFGLPGGYVGVDVFFVISGFLITRLIWKDLERGTFTFAGFWERRVRRIVPALVVVTLATLAAGWVFLLPYDYSSLGWAAASQAAFGANVHYWLSMGYFFWVAAEKPLLHTWSLAVEEQFYLVVPVMLWATHRSRRPWSRSGALAVASAIFAASFALSVYQVAYARWAAFYLLPARAWELALGSLVALAAVPPPASRLAREALAWGGLALIAAAAFGYSRATPFPGLAALPPCLGAALLIWANGTREDRPPTTAGALLSIRPVVAVGLVSYSLYLWHWPFLAFGRYLSLGPLSATVRIALVACGAVAAVISWRFVEVPCRRPRPGASRRRVFGWAAAALALTVAAGVACGLSEGVPQRLSPEGREYERTKSDGAFTESSTTESVRAGDLARIGVRDAGAPPAVVVWGDSHARSALPAFDALLRERGLAGRAALRGATAPVLDWYKTRDFGLGKDAPALADAVVDYVATQGVREVVLVSYWETYLDERGNDAGDGVQLDEAVVRTVRRLSAVGARTWVMLSVPRQPFDVPRARFLPFYSARFVESRLATPKRYKEFGENDARLAAEIEAAGGRLLDPKPAFLEPAGRFYRIELDGVTLYNDNHHLTPQGAKAMLLPFLRERLDLGAGT